MVNYTIIEQKYLNITVVSAALQNIIIQIKMFFGTNPN